MVRGADQECASPIFSCCGCPALQNEDQKIQTLVTGQKHVKMKWFSSSGALQNLQWQSCSVSSGDRRNPFVQLHIAIRGLSPSWTDHSPAYVLNKKKCPTLWLIWHLSTHIPEDGIPFPLDQQGDQRGLKDPILRWSLVNLQPFCHCADQASTERSKD